MALVLAHARTLASCWPRSLMKGVLPLTPPSGPLKAAQTAASSMPSTAAPAAAARSAPQPVACSASKAEQEQHQAQKLLQRQTQAAKQHPGGSGHGGDASGGRPRGDGGGAAAMAVALPLALLPPPEPPASFRFWLDEALWSAGYPSVELLDEVLVEAGGVRTGGPPRPPPRLKGASGAGQRHEARAVVPLISEELTDGASWQQQQGDDKGSTGGMQPSAAQPAQAAEQPSSSSGGGGTPLGWQRPSRWDVLWSKSTYALRAVHALRPGQLVSVVVGLNSLTMKKRMLQTLKAAYGPDAAACLTPLSFALPEELPEWRACLQQRRRQRLRGPTNGSPQGGPPAPAGEQQEEQEEHQQQPQEEEELWMLKTGQDAGKGLQLLPADQALAAAERDAQAPAAGRQAGKARPPTESSAPRDKHQLQVAQLYVSRPLLLEGRKFHLRLWLVVTAHSPLQAYMHRRGLVLFSSEPYEEQHPWVCGAAPQQPHVASSSLSAQQQSPPPHAPQAAQGSTSSQATPSRPASSSSQPPLSAASQRPGSGIAAGHITNLARNSSGLVWSLARLQQALGPRPYAALWEAMMRSTRLALGAAMAPLQEAHAWLKPPFPEYGFQLLGVDFLVDRSLRPWLLEFNSSPSIMALHDDAGTAELIRQEKRRMLADMWGLVRHRVYGPPAAGKPTAGTPRPPARGAPGSEWVVLFGSSR